ncbi:MAG: hypothetical protein ABI995_16990 [Acidobacteriota bacterium]
MAENTWVVRLNWHLVEEDDDPRWHYERAFYAYLPPRRRGIDYIGKCDGKTVRQRWNYDAKSKVWDCINERTQHHHVIVAEIETEARLTRKLVSDIESLLIYRVQQIQPLCNHTNAASRGKHTRPGMKIQCRGAWPLSQKTFNEID